ncbi:hypothetical protein DPMN_097603 [Dreissena polymorpha]|uniref:Uncharacterized protein n=1 Tax=Dreissena polymorpha TaxID=45954 RepID=A0A9D4R5J5_DREPO|nr:hypothetical protein DPMN_097603 [Dreissena polymorpha]
MSKVQCLQSCIERCRGNNLLAELELVPGWTWQVGTCITSCIVLRMVANRGMAL